MSWRSSAVILSTCLLFIAELTKWCVDSVRFIKEAKTKEPVTARHYFPLVLMNEHVETESFDI